MRALAPDSLPDNPNAETFDTRDTLNPVAPDRQRKGTGRRMSRRSGQAGSVCLVGKKWVGRYWRDTPEKREHVAVRLGEKPSMRKAAAKLKLKGILESEGINRPTYLETSTRPPVTFDDVYKQWELKKMPDLRYSSRQVISMRLRKHALPFFRERDVETIRTADVNDWIRWLKSKELAPKTVVNCYRDFRAVVNWNRREADRSKVTWYPTLPELPDVEQRWFTPQEATQIIDAAAGQYKVFFRLAAYTGMRCGELCGLRVEHLKLGNGAIEVSRSVWNGVEGPTKTKKGKRVVFIDSVTVQMLRDFLGGRQTGILFQSRVGTPLSCQEINRRVLKPICERLGIPVGTTHAFRHGRASLMQSQGMPADFVTSQIGHSSLRTTSIYTHFAPSQMREMTERLNNCTQMGGRSSPPN